MRPAPQVLTEAAAELIRGLQARQIPVMPAFDHEPVSHISSIVDLVVELIPKTDQQITEVERAVIDASADPENRKLVGRLAEQFARPEVQKLLP